MIGEFLEENHQFIWRIIFTVIIAIIGVKFLASRNARLKQSQPAKKPRTIRLEDMTEKQQEEYLANKRHLRAVRLKQTTEFAEKAKKVEEERREKAREKKIKEYSEMLGIHTSSSSSPSSSSSSSSSSSDYFPLDGYGGGSSNYRPSRGCSSGG